MLDQFFYMLRQRETQLVLASGALALSSITVLAVNLAGFFVGNLGVTPHNLKYIWAVGGGAGVITSQVCGWLSDRVGPFKVMTGVNVLAACLYETMFLYGGLGLPPLLLMGCS